MNLTPIRLPAHNLLCCIVTDDYGNQFQALPSVICREAHRAACDFWYDGLTDPDYFNHAIGGSK